MTAFNLVRDSFPARPAFDTAVSRAILLRVAAGELPPTLRVGRPGPMVAFGRQDATSAGYAGAVTAARAGGFEAVERLAGGRAAVFHENTLAFARATREAEPGAGIHDRFEEFAEIVVAAFARLGIESGVGEIAGEYCPGAYSAHVGGRKVMGVGQRLIKEGAHVGAVVVVREPERVRDVLVPVYAELGLEWRPETTGALADVAPGLTWEQAAEALIAELAERHALTEATLDEGTLALAEQLEPEHVAPTAEEDELAATGS